MVIRLTAANQVVLEAPDDFRRFSIALPPGTSLDALAPLAQAEGEDHAWITPDAVAGLHPAGGAEWRQGFAAMVAYAASKGWTDAQGRLRAHIERG